MKNSLFILIFPVIALVTIWKYFELFVISLFTSQGWFPSIEYIPLEQTLIVNDLRGAENLFNPATLIRLHRESLLSVEVKASEKGSWALSINTRKGETFEIFSTRRQSQDEVIDLARRFGIMVDFSEGQVIIPHPESVGGSAPD